MEKVQEELRQIRPQPWRIGQDFAKLRSKWVAGSWATEEAGIPYSIKWERER